MYGPVDVDLQQITVPSDSSCLDASRHTFVAHGSVIHVPSPRDEGIAVVVSAYHDSVCFDSISTGRRCFASRCLPWDVADLLERNGYRVVRDFDPPRARQPERGRP